ncbi:MAG: substrate-binding domain-containing protein [Sphingomonadales bacterium]|nr:substrate-binding domain-containing protein [Sphingomonadales bacterium]
MKFAAHMALVLGCLAGPATQTAMAQPAAAQPAAAPPVALNPGLRAYRPQPVKMPADAPYLLADGSIAIVGYYDMAHILERLNALFVARHRGFKFTLLLKGTATAAPSLTFGRSAFAPMGAEFSSLEMQAYRDVLGSEPLMVRIARDPPNSKALSGPVCIFVHPDNPLTSLTVDQVARIFTAGNGTGDLTQWRQLGLTGEWSERAIHVHSISNSNVAGATPFMVDGWFGGRFFRPEDSPRVDPDKRDPLVSREARVANDVGAIGMHTCNIVEWRRVKILKITPTDGGAPLSPMDVGQLMSGRYPFDRHLLIYARRDASGRVEPFIREYLRMILSREGQRIIAEAPPAGYVGGTPWTAAQLADQSAPGYLPLSAAEAAAELAKIR